jgi:hypothetical protein
LPSVHLHIGRLLRIPLTPVLAAVVLVFTCTFAQAQNTKGDKPARDSRFRSSSNKPKKKKSTGFRILPKSNSGSARRGGERVGQPIGPIYRSQPTTSGRSLSGKEPRKRVVVRSATSKASRSNVYSQRNSASSRPKDTQRAWRGSASGSRIKVRSATSRVSKQNVYSRQGGDFKNFRSPIVQPPVSNKIQLAKAKRYGTQPTSSKRKVTVVPRSASRSFIRTKSINPYAGFFRVKRKGEQATTKDIAGRTLRTRNYQTPPQEIITPEKDPYRGRKRVGDRAYKGPAAGFHQSASRLQPKAWTGDIAGRKIRGKNYVSPRQLSNRPIYPPKLAKARTGDHPRNNRMVTGGFQSRTSKYSGRVGKPIPGKTPGRNAALTAQFQNKLRGQKSTKGGGTRSGGSWNNNNQPVPAREPGIGAKGVLYSGNLKTRKPVKGGGSISGKLWNNNAQPIPVRTPPGRAAKAATYPGGFKHFELYPGMSPQGEEFTGFIKRGKPVKGGGSISGKLWNNNAQPIPVRVPPSSAAKAATYPGGFRHFELHPSMSPQGEEFTGFIKRGKYTKNPNQHASAILKKDQRNAHLAGGLQIKMKQQGYARNKNAHEDALLKRDPGGNVFKTGGLQIRVESPGYTQNKNAHEQSILKRKPSQQTFDVHGLTTKLKQPGWARNKNAHEDALLKRDLGSNFFSPDGLQIRVQSPGYAKNKNAHEASLLKRKPSEVAYKVNNLTTKMKQPGWARNKNAHEDALLKRDPSKNVFATGEIYGRIKAYNYKASPSGVKEALRVREPGKAFAKATQYQGNIKMQKFNFFKHTNYHPDAAFVKTNKNNVKDERDVLTNFKLFWAKLFRKSENQPDNLKEKVRKPRYDKREIGIWND